ncbi:unnamed protein product, partial [Protopolystoma xenopodis]
MGYCSADVCLSTGEGLAQVYRKAEDFFAQSNKLQSTSILLRFL